MELIGMSVTAPLVIRKEIHCRLIRNCVVYVQKIGFFDYKGLKCSKVIGD